jgi:TRAP-type C4-dicarboxylate transport system substrate-binding protein
MKWSSVKSYKAKIGFLASVFLVIILAVTLLPACTAAPAEEITLTLVSGWPLNVAFNDKVHVWVGKVNEAGEGKVFIDFLGGPEVAAITEQVGLVRDGVYDMTKTTPGYYGGLCPAAVPLYYAKPFDPVKMRENGITALADEFHRAQAGVTLLGFTTRGEPFTIVSKEPITSADFSGILMHTLPIFTASLTYLGASTTTLQVADFYVALQTGQVDAIPCPLATVPWDYGLYEVADYLLKPWMPITTTGMILINEARWEGLPEDVKELLTDKMIETEAEVIEHFEAATDAVVEKLVTEGGMEIVELTGAEREKYMYAFTDYGWEQFCEKNPEWVPQLYELSKPYLD